MRRGSVGTGIQNLLFCLPPAFWKRINALWEQEAFWARLGRCQPQHPDRSCCAATYASVNQLRGRSIRKTTASQGSLPTTGCGFAAGLEKGSNDLRRLHKKHKQFYSICADGRIQKGVNHVDPSLAFLDDLDIDTINHLNERMMSKASDRDSQYDMWRIGEKFVNVEQESVEFTMDRAAVPCDTGVFTLHSAKLRGRSTANKFKGGAGTLAFLAAVISAGSSIPVAIAFGAVSALFFRSTTKGIKNAAEYSRKNVLSMDSLEFARKMRLCLFYALQGSGFISRNLLEKHVNISRREDGSIRVFLDAPC